MLYELVSLLAITQDPVYTEMVDKLPLLHVLAASMPQLQSIPVALHNKKVRVNSFCWPSEGAYVIAFLHFLLVSILPPRPPYPLPPPQWESPSIRSFLPSTCRCQHSQCASFNENGM